MSKFKRTDKFKPLLESERKHISVGSCKENGEPFMFYRIPDAGGVLLQSLCGGKACYALSISEGGEIEGVLPVHGMDFKTKVRFLLEITDSQNLDDIMSGIDKAQAELADLAEEKTEVI